MGVPLRDDTRTARLPVMTWTLIGLCVFVFAFLQPPAYQRYFTGDSALSTPENISYEFRWGGVACEITHLKRLDQHPNCDRTAPPGFHEGAKNIWFSLLTLMFIHGGLDHIIGNLLFLWVFGRLVEDRLGPIGIVALYLVGGIVATLTFAMLNSGSTEPLLGASGAIAAVMGAYLVLRPRGKILTFVTSTTLLPLYLPAWAVLGFFFASQFLISPNEGVAWQAHVGGMAFGIVVALVLRFLMPSLRRSAERALASTTAGEVL